MPYISRNRRNQIFPIGPTDGDFPKNAGELNFVITSYIREYFKEHRNYQGINDIIGALEGAKLEFYRRVAIPYEDTKIEENGDVY